MISLHRKCKSTSNTCFQRLLLNFGRIPVWKQLSEKTLQKFSFFFVDCKVWNLSFQTPSNSSKNVKNSLSMAIFRHSWFEPKMGSLGHNTYFLGKQTWKVVFMVPRYPNQVILVIGFWCRAPYSTGTGLMKVFNIMVKTGNFGGHFEFPVTSKSQKVTCLCVMSIFKMEYIIWLQKQSSRLEKLNY